MAHVKNQFSPEPNSNKRPLASSRESFYKSESKQDCFEEKQKTWKDDFFFFKKERRKEIAQTFSNDIILLLRLLLLLRFTQHLHFSRDEGTHTHTRIISVARFGKISSPWQHFKSFRHFFDGWAKILKLLRQIAFYRGNFLCRKWPKIEQIM